MFWVSFLLEKMRGGSQKFRGHRGGKSLFSAPLHRSYTDRGRRVVARGVVLRRQVVCQRGSRKGGESKVKCNDWNGSMEGTMGRRPTDSSGKCREAADRVRKEAARGSIPKGIAEARRLVRCDGEVPTGKD